MNNKTKWLLALGGALGAAATTFFILKNRKEKEAREKPPKGAPQLKLENPGSQAEFPTSATESEIG